MKRLLNLVLAFFPIICVGCTAGVGADLVGYDAIIAANQEAAKGVEALRVGLEGTIARDKGQLMVNLHDWVKQAATQPDDAEGNATEIVARMTKHLAEIEEQQARLELVVGPTMDNLAFAIDVAQKAKKLVIYRSDMTTQWKEYLLQAATARSRINATSP
jgi:hypothetical protein